MVEEKNDVEGKKEPEVIPPQDTANNEKYNALTQIAAITQYTERPDLFINAIEEADPGFIKRMNEKSEKFSDKFRLSRFNFGRFQSYTALIISALAALSLIGALIYTIYLGQASFWIIIALSIFYAISQGGSKGFVKIIDAIHQVITKIKKD